jgi:hypothetical protein
MPELRYSEQSERYDNLAVEIAPHHRGDLVEHMLAERFADRKILPRNAQGHSSSRLLLVLMLVLKSAGAGAPTLSPGVWSVPSRIPRSQTNAIENARRLSARRAVRR